jgi:hypothetical protein
MTLLARDEADIVDAQLAFHLNAGVDFVIATDNRSVDGTTEIFESYARQGVLRLLREPGDDHRHGEWVTRMAHLAATEHDADWVFHPDADEFWWPRDGSFKEIFAAVPDRYGIVRSFWLDFVPRPDDGRPFWERMTVRRFPYQSLKVAHRARADVTVGFASHNLLPCSLMELPGWHPMDVLHFSVRTWGQYAHKIAIHGAALARNEDLTPRAGRHVKQPYELLQAGRLEEHYRSLVVDDAAVEKGLADGSLVIDRRVEERLRVLRGPDGYRLPAPGASDDAAARPDLDAAINLAERSAAVREKELRAELKALRRRLPEQEGGRLAGLRRKAAALRARGD